MLLVEDNGHSEMMFFLDRRPGIRG